MAVEAEIVEPVVEPSLMDAPPVEPAAETPEQIAAREAEAAASKEPELTDEQKAAAEVERRAALSDDERAEEDRRAALTDDERAAEDAEAEKANGAPDEYATFELPEGVELQPEITDEFKAFAKDANLPQAKAQAVVDMGVKLMQSWTDQAIATFNAERQSWREASQADPEFGGKKLTESLAAAVKARDGFGTPEFKAVLDKFGLGDHPEVIRFLTKVGKTISEDNFVKPGNKAEGGSPANLIFDHPSNKRAAS
jgi:hypothetical protein